MNTPACTYKNNICPHLYRIMTMLYCNTHYLCCRHCTLRVWLKMSRTFRVLGCGLFARDNGQRPKDEPRLMLALLKTYYIVSVASTFHAHAKIRHSTERYSVRPVHAQVTGKP